MMAVNSTCGAQSVAFSPNGGGEAFMSIGNYIYKSTNGGDNWGVTPIPLNSMRIAIAETILHLFRGASYLPNVI